jgi:integrase
MHRLTVHVFGHGERVPMLLDAQGTPLFYPTLFTTAQLRNAGAAVNTIRNKLTDVLVFLRWEQAQTQRRDVVTEFAEGRFLTVADIVSLRDFAARDMRDVGECGFLETNGARTAELAARLAVSSPLATIGAKQHYNRLSTIADYLEFVGSVVTQHRHSAADATSIERMGRTIRKHRPRGLAARMNEGQSDQSPPTELVERFMAVGAPDHPKNPFQDPGVRLRNAIIFGLLRHSTIRRGELLSLRLDQFEFGHEPSVWVRRNQDDSADSRRYQPVAKTKERPMPLPLPLAEQIQHYVMNVRARLAPARRHPYLLVSHRNGATFGRPLSLSALSSQIFAAMRKVDPAFAAIHPHAFRHHFNYELSCRIDSHNKSAKELDSGRAIAPISEGRELDVRAFLNGHRSRASGAAYNRRHVREVSEKAARDVQDELAGRVSPKGSK